MSKTPATAGVLLANVESRGKQPSRAIANKPALRWKLARELKILIDLALAFCYHSDVINPRELTRKRREACGWRQYELARHAEMSAAQVSLIENNRVSPISVAEAQ